MRLRHLLSIFMLAVYAHAATPVTVSGTLNSASSLPVAGNTNNFVIFHLRNFAGFTPKVTGTGIIVQTEVKVIPASDGTFSQTLWANDDIVPNTCGAGGTSACTWYTVEFWQNSKVSSSGNYCIPNTSPTFNLNSATPCLTPPLPPAPANGNNSSISGTLGNLIKFSGPTTGANAAVTELAGVLRVPENFLLTGGGFDASAATYFRPQFGLSAAKPATCAVGDVYEATDATAGQNWFFCTSTNVWTQQLNSGGGGSITLKTNGTPNSSPSTLNLQNDSGILVTDHGSGNIGIGVNSTTFVPIAPGADVTIQAVGSFAIHFKCPAGAVSGFVCQDFLKPDGANNLSMSAGGTFTFGDGTSNAFSAARFIHATGTVSATGIFAGTDTDVLFGWRNHANSGDCVFNKDASDNVNIVGCAHLKFGSNFVAQATAGTAGYPTNSSGSEVFYSSAELIDACAPTFVGADDCTTLKNAALAAVSLGMDVDARCLTGHRACAVDPIPDTYNGRIFLGPSIWHIQSNVADWTLPSRIDIFGVGPGRAAAGPTSGTIIQACNNDNSACAGATYNPSASTLCKDGAGTGVPCALISWGKSGDHGTPSVKSFDSKVSHLDIDCNGIANCIGIQDGMFPVATIAPGGQSGNCSGKCGAQENSGAEDIRVENFGNGTGKAVNLLYGAQNSEWVKMNLLNEGVAIADCSASVAINSFQPPPSAGNGPKTIEQVTNTNSACVINPQQAMFDDQGETSVIGFHAEQVSNTAIEVAKNSDVLGGAFINVNGVTGGSSNGILHINTGHSVGVAAFSILNINTSGYTIKNEITTSQIKVTCENETGSYTFSNEGIYTQEGSSSACIPKVVTTSGYISNTVLTQYDCVKPAASAGQLTQCGLTDTEAPLGITLAAIPTNAIQIPVAVSGVVTGPIAHGTCAARDYFYRSATTAGQWDCSATGPDNVWTAGYVITGATNAAMTVFIQIAPPHPRLDVCTATGTNPAACSSSVIGVIACPHSTSAGTCVVNTTAFHSLTLSTVTITRSNQLGAGCEAVPTETAASLVPVLTGVANTSFTVNVPTLPTALSQYCFNYEIRNTQ